MIHELLISSKKAPLFLLAVLLIDKQIAYDSIF